MIDFSIELTIWRDSNGVIKIKQKGSNNLDYQKSIFCVVSFFTNYTSII